MKRFILLLDHDDRSLSDYLQNRAEQGEFISACNGNLFSFERRPYQGERIAAVTLACDDPGLKMKFQIEDYAAYMKKKGWKLLCSGGPENIFDSRRHVFLQTDQTDLPMPEPDPAMTEKAEKRHEKTVIRCIVLLLLLLGFGIFFASHDLDVFLSGTHLLICMGLAGILALVSAVFCVEHLIDKTRKTELLPKNFLKADRAVLACLLAFAALAAGFLIDNAKIRSSQQVIIVGNDRITLYRDQIPVSMDDLEVPLTARFRSTKLTERKSPLLSYVYGVDQSFDSPNSAENLSRMACTLYRTEKPFISDILMNRKTGIISPDEELAAEWHADSAYRLTSRSALLRYRNDVLIFSASFEPSLEQIEILLEKLTLTE